MEINHFVGEGIEYDIRRCENIIEQIFKDHEVVCGTLNVVQVDDEELLEMNKRHLNHDYYTDIITFRTDEVGSIDAGELYISYDRAKANNPRAMGTEVLRLIFHGCLHLCGWDDDTTEMRELMSKEEDKYLLFHVEQ